MLSLLSLFIGLRFSYGRNRSDMVTLTSMISTIGIALGVAVLIIGLSAMNGFERELNTRILASVSHGEIESVNNPLTNWLQVLQKITQVDGVIDAIPYIRFDGLIENGANLRVIQIKGINPWQEVKFSKLSSFVQNDSWKKFQSGKQQIIIGKGIADTLRVKQGEWVSVMFPYANNNNYKDLQFNVVRLCIVGILQMNNQIDYNFAVVPLEDARIYSNMEDSITGISIKVNDAFNANKIMHNIRKILDNHICVKSWINSYGYIYNDIQMVRSIIYLAMILVIVISCFNVVSMLIIAVKSKRYDIAILRTFGAKGKLVSTIFIWYAVLVCLTGSLYGMIIGITISLQLASIIRGVEQLINSPILSSKIYFIDFLPSELHILDLIYILVIIFLLSLLASCYPAYRASQIDPIKILRNQ